MASFGEGFSEGLIGGYAVMDNWIDRYEQKQEKEITNKLFQTALDMQQQKQGLDAKGEQFRLFANKTPGDIASMIMQEAMANGIKIDGNTAQLAMGVGQVFSKGMQEYQKYEQNNMLFNKKIDNMNSIMAKRNMMKQTQQRQYKPSNLIQNADYIRSKYGDEDAKKYVSAQWTAKQTPDFEEYGTENNAMETKQESETKKKTWRDYLNKKKD